MSLLVNTNTQYHPNNSLPAYKKRPYQTDNDRYSTDRPTETLTTLTPSAPASLVPDICNWIQSQHLGLDPPIWIPLLLGLFALTSPTALHFNHLHTLLGPSLIFFLPPSLPSGPCSALLLALSCPASPGLASPHIASSRFPQILPYLTPTIDSCASINTLELDLDNVVLLAIVTYQLASQWS